LKIGKKRDATPFCLKAAELKKVVGETRIRTKKKGTPAKIKRSGFEISVLSRKILGNTRANKKKRGPTQNKKVTGKMKGEKAVHSVSPHPGAWSGDMSDGKAEKKALFPGGEGAMKGEKKTNGKRLCDSRPSRV